MRRPRFRQLPHPADVRLAVWGSDEEELVGNAVAGALACALGRVPRARPQSWYVVEGWPEESGERLVRAVNEALFLLYARGQLALAARVTATGLHLATAPLLRGRSPEVEVKAATFHDLEITAGARLRAVLTLDL
jgi:SHS2 domain-containing protein